MYFCANLRSYLNLLVQLHRMITMILIEELLTVVLSYSTAFILAIFAVIIIMYNDKRCTV